jgi:hypothetical protein
MTSDEKRMQSLEWAAIAVLITSVALLVWIFAGVIADITS